MLRRRVFGGGEIVKAKRIGKRECGEGAEGKEERDRERERETEPEAAAADAAAAAV